MTISDDSRVFIIDDDPFVCKGLSRLLHSAGYQSETYHSASAYLERKAHDGAACLVLDIRMPQMSGIELQHVLNKQKSDIPIIFLTAHGDIPMGVSAIKFGAEDFLIKPIDEMLLLDAIRKALVKHQSKRTKQLQENKARSHMETLTHRELEVLEYILGGYINHQIGTILGITEKTVKAHRGKIMHKLKVNTAAELGWISSFTDIKFKKLAR